MLTELETAVAVFVVYWGIVEILKRRGILDRHGITAYGPLLLVRTKRGLSLLDKLAKTRKFWKIYANAGLPAVFAGMAFMFALILVADVIMLTHPPKPSEITSPRAAVLLPGINPFIPVVWGTIGLVVTLVVHEFSHAILCRVEGVKVKALGVIFALLPVGGFAEPDEEELLDKSRTSSSSRIRIFSAGVVTNFIVAAVAFLLFFNLLGMVHPAIIAVSGSGVEGKVLEINGFNVSTPDDVHSAIGEGEWVTLLLQKDGKVKTLKIPNIQGVRIIGLYREDDTIYPAEKAGMKARMLITKIDGTRVRTYEDFQKKMSELNAGQSVSVYVYDNGTTRVFNVTLAEKNGKGFLGVYVQTFDSVDGVDIIYTSLLLDSLKSLPEQMKTFRGWLYLIAMPFRFQGFTGEYENLFDAPQWLFWTLNTLYWIAWINFYVGLFNCLPAIPLDGGRVFHEVFSRLLARKYGEELGEEISMKVVKFFAFVVFFSILLSIAIPNLEGLI